MAKRQKAQGADGERRGQPAPLQELELETNIRAEQLAAGTEAERHREQVEGRALARAGVGALLLSGWGHRPAACVAAYCKTRGAQSTLFSPHLAPMIPGRLSLCSVNSPRAQVRVGMPCTHPQG